MATILVKNEEDIIGKMIEHHISQGINQFIITDNNSTDNTKSVISKYPEVKEIIDSKDETHNQSISVNNMAKLAIKFNPDWIIHLDADEFWYGIDSLKKIKSFAFSSNRCFVHPPVSLPFTLENFRYYLDFNQIIPDECKIGHRPCENIQISHGNHGFNQDINLEYTSEIYRHHYPIRSYNQLVSKCSGHLSLLKRNSICKRWEKWYKMYISGTLFQEYQDLCTAWENMISVPKRESLLKILNFWATQEVIDLFKKSSLPLVKQ